MEILKKTTFERGKLMELHGEGSSGGEATTCSRRGWREDGQTTQLRAPGVGKGLAALCRGMPIQTRANVYCPRLITSIETRMFIRCRLTHLHRPATRHVNQITSSNRCRPTMITISACLISPKEKNCHRSSLTANCPLSHE